jgi:hypothetical protein
LVTNTHPDIFKAIIRRFEFQIGSSTGHEEVRAELKSKFIHDDYLTFVSDKLSGWFSETVMSKIASQEIPVVHWVDLAHQLTVCVERIRRRELIDFARKAPPTEAQIKGDLDARPLYVKQLDQIELDDDRIIEAVTDYLRADINREKWIEIEIIDEDLAEEFEENLRQFWQNERQRISITEAARDNISKGQLLYLGCQSRQQMIRDMSPPPSTVSGTYHALADEPVLGWHPDWHPADPTGGAK